MLLSRIAPLSALFLVSTFVGCAIKTEDVAATTSELADPSSAAETFETIKLSTQPDAPSSRCDIQTILALAPPRADSSRYARLHDEVAGGCKMAIDPDPREYLLSFNGTSCGSMMYSANNTRDGRQLTMTDHRTRVCADLVQANVIVIETSKAGGVLTLYSIDGFVRFNPPDE